VQYAEQANPPAAAQTTQNVPHTDVPLASGYGAAEQHGARPLSQEDFLARVSGAKERINQLTADIQAISNIHQRMLSSPDNRSSAELEAIVSQTQIRNTQIKDEIKFLERDAGRDPSNSLKQSQVKNLKSTFKKQLEDFQREEADYSKRYREAIGRQYRIINPEATDAEVQEAQNSDWGDEGIFTQAVGHASQLASCYLALPQAMLLTAVPNPSSSPIAPAKPRASSAPSAPATTTSNASRRPCRSSRSSSPSSTSRSCTKKLRSSRQRSKQPKSRATRRRRTCSSTRASRARDGRGSSSGGRCLWWC